MSEDRTSRPAGVRISASLLCLYPHATVFTYPSGSKARSVISRGRERPCGGEGSGEAMAFGTFGGGGGRSVGRNPAIKPMGLTGIPFSCPFLKPTVVLCRFRDTCFITAAYPL